MARDQHIKSLCQEFVFSDGNFEIKKCFLSFDPESQ